MKRLPFQADPRLAVEGPHPADPNQTWPDARGEATDPGPPPSLDRSTGLGRDEDSARTQRDFIGPGGQLVGFGALRPDVKVQADSAGHSAARYEVNAVPARSVLPIEEDTSRRVVVNQTQPIVPATRAAKFGIAEPEREAPLAGAHREDARARGAVDEVRTVSPLKARRMWLAIAPVVILLVIVRSGFVLWTSSPSATTTAPRTAAMGAHHEPLLATATPPVVDPTSAPTGLVSVQTASSSSASVPSLAPSALPIATRMPTVVPRSPPSPSTSAPSASPPRAAVSAERSPTVIAPAQAEAHPVDPAPKNDIDRTLRP